MPAGSVSGEGSSWLAASPLLTVFSRGLSSTCGHGERDHALPLPIRALTLSRGLNPHDLIDPSYLPKAPPPNIITLGVRASNTTSYQPELVT